MRSRIASLEDAVAITRIYNEGIEDRGASYPGVVVEDEVDVLALAETTSVCASRG